MCGLVVVGRLTSGKVDAGTDAIGSEGSEVDAIGVPCGSAPACETSLEGQVV